MNDPIRPVDMGEVRDAYVLFYRRPGLTEESLRQEFTATMAKVEYDAIAAKLRVLADTFNANGNSRELGDPTARTWHEAARLLLDAIPDQGHQ